LAGLCPLESAPRQEGGETALADLDRELLHRRGAPGGGGERALPGVARPLVFQRGDRRPCGRRINPERREVALESRRPSPARRARGHVCLGEGALVEESHCHQRFDGPLDGRLRVALALELALELASAVGPVLQDPEAGAERTLLLCRGLEALQGGAIEV